MAQTKKQQISFGTTLTANEAIEHMDAVNQFIGQMKADVVAVIDAGNVTYIDTAGCQLIDLAITAALMKKAKPEVCLSEPVQQAFGVLGIQTEGVIDEVS